MTLAHALTLISWVAVPIFSAAVAYLIASLKAKNSYDEAMKQGMRALLRQQLINYHKEYVASGNPCPVRIKEQATAIYDAYHAIGGNGTGTQLWREIMDAHVE